MKTFSFMEQKEFFEKYSISEEEFNKTGLNWEELLNIAKDHEDNKSHLDNKAKYIVNELLVIQEKFYSIRYRVKITEHLIEKIIRKTIAKYTEIEKEFKTLYQICKDKKFESQEKIDTTIKIEDFEFQQKINTPIKIEDFKIFIEKQIKTYDSLIEINVKNIQILRNKRKEIKEIEEQIKKIEKIQEFDNEQILKVRGLKEKNKEERENFDKLKVFTKVFTNLKKICKSILKKINEKININNYKDKVTDLIGIRLTHLYKEDWKEIHKEIKGWNKIEEPFAYIRKGDNTDSFKEEGLKIKEHESCYRSIHYVLKVNEDKEDKYLPVEIQVRTIFEEGWSEIDHNVRYPNNKDDKLLNNFLSTFNRLAGSADEMGTFVYLYKEKTKEYEEEKEKIINEYKQKEKEQEEIIKTLEQKIKDIQSKIVTDIVRQQNNLPAYPKDNNRLQTVKNGFQSLHKRHKTADTFSLFNQLFKDGPKCSECGTPIAPHSIGGKCGSCLMGLNR